MSTYNITVKIENISQLKGSKTFNMSPIQWKDDTSADTNKFITRIKMAFEDAVDRTTDVSESDKKSVIEQMNKINAGNARSEYIDEYGWLTYEFVR